jgi:hypothetical protein
MSASADPISMIPAHDRRRLPRNSPPVMAEIRSARLHFDDHGCLPPVFARKSTVIMKGPSRLGQGRGMADACVMGGVAQGRRGA